MTHPDTLTIPRAVVEQALKRAYQLGQTYWQQADSDSWTQNKKSDETQVHFNALVTKTCEALQPQADTSVLQAAPWPPAGETLTEPEAMRYDFDGYGWKYIDNGSGSDWMTRHPEGEFLFTKPQALQPQATTTTNGPPERDLSKPAEQQGVFRKFNVQRTDGSDKPGGKHHGCEYFVLDVAHDQHAKPALEAYANACAITHPQLSADMRERYGLQPQDTQPKGLFIDMIAQHPGLAEELKGAAEPVAYEFRMRADWVADWGMWSPCNKEHHEMYIRAPKLHDWHYETRALYTSPPDHTKAMRLALSMLHFMNDNGYRLEEYEQGRMDAAIAQLEALGE